LSLTEKGIALKEKAKDMPIQLMESIGITEQELLELKNIVTKILNKKK